MRADLLARLGRVGHPSVPLWGLVQRVDAKNTDMTETNLLSLSYGNIVRKDIDQIGGLRPASYATYNIVERGDTVLRMTDLQNDQKSIRTGMVLERGIITSAYVTVRPNNDRVSGRFLSYVLRAYDIHKVFYDMGAGVRQTLKFDELAELPIPLPDLPTQRRIADYLDRETGEIDAMLAKLDGLVGALNQRLTATIDAELLPFQREALKPFWSVAEAITGLTFAPSDVVEEGGTVVHRSGSVQDGRIDRSDLLRVSTLIPHKLRIVDGDILVCSRNGSPRLVGKSAVLGPEERGETWGAFMTVLRSSQSRILRWYLRSSMFAAERGRFSTSTINQLTIGTFNGLKLPDVPLQQQPRLADHLDEVAGRIDAMLVKVAKLKELLAERRAALITEVVTGRKEVE